MKELTPKKTDNNGRFVTGNNGKPKGAVNKTTKQLKEIVTNFLHDKAFEIPLIWDSLDDKDKLIVWIQLSKLVLPKSNEDAPELIEERERVKVVFTKRNEPIKELTALEAKRIANELENEF